MPRQIYTYEPDRGWTLLNQIISRGRFHPGDRHSHLCVQPGALVFSRRDGGADPWDAWTLEWSTPSPPPAYNFAVDPVVASRRPLWDLKHPEDPDSAL